jgi:hypothetical protein
MKYSLINFKNRFVIKEREKIIAVVGFRQTLYFYTIKFILVNNCDMGAIACKNSGSDLN